MITVCLLFSSCGKKGNKNEVQNGDVEFYGRTSISDNYAFEENEDKLYLWDLKNNAYEIFCSQPDCKHLTVAEDPNTKCTAVLPKKDYHFDYAFIYNDKLYTFCSYNINEFLVYISDTDGMNRKLAFTSDISFSDMTSPALVDGKLAFVGREIDTGSSGILDGDTEEQYYLCVLDLSDMTLEKYTDIGLASETFIGRESLNIYKNKIYFDHCEYTEDSAHSTVEYFDTESSERKTVIEDDANINVWGYEDGKMIYVVSTDNGTHSQVCTYDLEEEKTETLLEGDKYFSDVYISGDKIFCQYSTYPDDETEIRSAGVYDKSGKEIASVDFDEDVYISVMGHTSNGHLIHYQNATSTKSGIISDDAFWSLDLENGDFHDDIIQIYQAEETEHEVQYGNDGFGFTRFDVDAVTEAETYENKTKLVYLTDYDTMFNTTDEDPRIYDETYIENAVNEYLDKNGYDFYVDFIMNGEFDFKTRDIYPNIELYEKMLDNNEQVDIVNTGAGLSNYGGYDDTFHLFVEKGYLEPLNDYFETEYGKEFYDGVDELIWTQTTCDDGKIYGEKTDSLLASPLILSFNSEMCEKYGIDTDKIEKLEDLEPYFETLTEEGKKGLLLNSTCERFHQMAGFCKYKGIYINAENSKAENIFENKKVLEYLKTISEYRKKGYIANDSYVNNDYICELSVAMPLNYDSSKIVSNGYVETKELNEVVGISSESENKEKAFQLLSLLNTDRELANIIYNGVEGRNYEIDDGVKNPNKNALPFYDAHTTMTDPFIAESNSQDNPNKESDLAACLEHSEISPFYGLEISEDLEKRIEEAAKIYDEFYGVFYGNYGEYETLDAALEAANKKLKDAGIDEILDELNEQYAAAQ